MAASGRAIRVPGLTLAVAAAVMAAFALPDLDAALAYDRARILDGEIWRLVTGQLCHHDARHLFWGGTVFLALAGWLETRHPRLLRAALPVSALAVGLALLAALPGMAAYRGLSGVDTALAVLVVGEALPRARGGWRMAGWLLLALILAKAGYEWASGDALFVPPDGGRVPVPLAHLAGAVAGAALAAFGRPRPARSAPALRSA